MRARVWAVSLSVAVLAACGDEGSTRDSGDATTGSDTDSAPATDATSGPDSTSGGRDQTTSPTTESAETTVTPGTATQTTDDPTADSTDGTTASPETSGGPSSPSSILLTIDNGATPPRLAVIDLDSAASSPACDLSPTATYDTLTFLRDETLLAHNVALDRIEVLDPCTCGFQVIGPTSIGSMEMTVDARGGMYGVDPDFDAFVSINPDTGLASVIGPLGFDLLQGGIAFSDADQLPYLIDAEADQLHTIDVTTGMATAVATITADLSTPGLAFREDAMYACSGDNLYTVDTVSGQATLIGPMGLVGACDNLAAPSEAIECLR